MTTNASFNLFSPKIFSICLQIFGNDLANLFFFLYRQIWLLVNFLDLVSWKPHKGGMLVTLQATVIIKMPLKKIASGLEEIVNELCLLCKLLYNLIKGYIYICRIYNKRLYLYGTHYHPSSCCLFVWVLLPSTGVQGFSSLLITAWNIVGIHKYLLMNDIQPKVKKEVNLKNGCWFR